MFDAGESERLLESACKARGDLARLVQDASPFHDVSDVVAIRLARSVSRAIESFDDCNHLYENVRLTSTIVLARAFVEQVGYSARIRVVAAEHEGSPDHLEAKLLELDQSSEQRQRMFKGQVDPVQMYTEAALEKFGTKTPATKPNESIAALQWALDQLGDTEGKARLMYSALSEHTHPILFSVVHAYTVQPPATPISLGLLTVDHIRHAYIRWAMAQMLLLHLLWVTRHQTSIVPAR